MIKISLRTQLLIALVATLAVGAAGIRAQTNTQSAAQVQAPTPLRPAPKDLTKQLVDLQKRVGLLEEAHKPFRQRKTTRKLDLKRLAEILGDAGEARIKAKSQDPFERLIVLGYKDDVYFTINRSDGTDYAVQNVTIEIPDGTTRVLVFMRGWLLGFAETGSDESTVRGIVDHHLGVEYANVRVQEVGVHTATLRAVMILRDINGDDRWTGWVNAVAVFLGPHP